MKKSSRNRIRKWAAILSLGRLPLQHQAAQFVEIVAEIGVEDWRLISIKEGANPEIPADVLERVEK